MKYEILYLNGIRTRVCTHTSGDAIFLFIDGFGKVSDLSDAVALQKMYFENTQVDTEIGEIHLTEVDINTGTFTFTGRHPESIL